MSYRRRLMFPALIALTAILLATSPPARTRLGGWLIERGKKAAEAGERGVAVRYLDWALRLDGDLVEAKFERALYLQQQGKVLEARRELDLLAEANLDGSLFGPTHLHARFLLVDGTNHFRLDKNAAALERFEACARLARQLEDPLTEARALLESSYVLQYSLQRSAEALELLHQALDLAEAQKHPLFIAEILAEIGQIEWHFKRAIDDPLPDYYLPALKIYREHDSREMVAHVLGKISNYYLTTGQIAEFFSRAFEALEIQQELGNTPAVAESHTLFGRVYSHFGNHRKARLHLEKSLELSRQTGDQYSYRRASWGLAGWSSGRGHPDEAIAYLKQAPAPDDRIYWSSLGHAELRMGDFKQAAKSLHRALALKRSTEGCDPTFELTALTGLASSQLQSGDSTTAEATLDQASSHLASVIDRRALSAYFQTRADLAEWRGESDTALTYLIEAAEAESRVLGSLLTPLAQGPSQDLRNRLLNTLLSSDADLASDELLLAILEEERYHRVRDLVLPWSRQSKSGEAANTELFGRIERASRALRDEKSLAAVVELRRAYAAYEDQLLKDGLLKDRLSDSRFGRIRATRPVDLVEIQNALVPEVAVVIYVITDAALHALVVNHSSLERVELPITPEQLVPKVKLFRRLLFEEPDASFAKQTGSEPWRPLARELYLALVAPIEQRGFLDNRQRIGLIAQGVLHDVPFAALLGPESVPRLLVERFSLFRPPSASFLARKRENPAPRSAGLLAMGLDKAADSKLPVLAFAAAEAQAVARISGGEVLTNARASETKFKQVAAKFNILHLATHGVVEPEMPLLSRLIMAPGAQDDGQLHVGEIFDLDLRADLVTLSACRTALSFPASGRPGSEVDRTGFIEAFLYAGASSVLASLLPVSDQPTTQLMSIFYTHLQTMNKADALAESQRAMLRGEVSYSAEGEVHSLHHPRYWAPFVLVGRDR